MKWFLTGDTHGQVTPIVNFAHEHPGDAIIILGDAGWNYYGDSSDRARKTQLAHLPIEIYCVRGNHERRPEDVPGMGLIYDGHTQNYCYWEEEYPNIKYFQDGEIYTINDKNCLILGGGYSVDKWYRLERGYEWFENEQLSCDEMNYIYDTYKGRHFDCILSHTCPLGWQPTDLFLPGLDQSTVDSTMEVWMDEFRRAISFNAWCWGHYHDDRESWTLDGKHLIMLYYKVIEFDNIFSKNVIKDHD